MSTRLQTIARLFIAFAAGAPQLASAQSLTRTDPSGDFRLEFEDLDGAHHVMTIEASDLIAPSIGVSLTRSGGTWTYVYSLSNADNGRARPGRGVWLWMVQCGARGDSVTARGTSRWRAVARDLGTAKICEFQRPTSAPRLDPGMSISGFSLESHSLPAIGTAKVLGIGDVPHWPVETDRVARSVLALADSVAGVSYWDNSGVAVATLLPLRDPATIVTGSRASVILREDIQTVCSQFHWIDREGICRSLSAKVEAAHAAFDRGQVQPARNQLTAFVAELDAQRGKGVNEEAYLLLTSLASFALAKF